VAGSVLLSEAGATICVDGMRSVDGMIQCDMTPMSAFKCARVVVENQTPSDISITELKTRGKAFGCNSVIPAKSLRVVNLIHESHRSADPTFEFSYVLNNSASKLVRSFDIRLRTTSSRDAQLEWNTKYGSEGFLFLMDKAEPTSRMIKWRCKKEFAISRIECDLPHCVFSSRCVDSYVEGRDNWVVTEITGKMEGEDSRSCKVKIHTNDAQIGTVVMWAFRRSEREWWGLPLEKDDDLSNPPIVLEPATANPADSLRKIAR
jgi:hypothetical protein